MSWISCPWLKLVHVQPLAHDLSHRHARVQAGVWVLEDHLHGPPYLAQLFAFELHQIDALKIYVTGSWTVELQDRPPGG